MNMRSRPECFAVAPEIGLEIREHTRAHRRSRAPIGQILVDMGALQSGDMLRAVAMRAREDVPIGQILLSNGLITEASLLRALAVQHDCEVVDPVAAPHDPRLVEFAGVDLCLRLNILPWKLVGVVPVVVTSDPAQFAQAIERLPAPFSNALMALAPQSQINEALARHGRTQLSCRAEERTEAGMSCRDFRKDAVIRVAAAVLASLTVLSVLFPEETLALVSGGAAMILALLTALKCASLFAALRPSRPSRVLFRSCRSGQTPMVLPIVSILVPLYHETAIAGRLVRRLSRLEYPRELLDICLVVEEDDLMTLTALRSGQLSPNMQIVVVPRGQIKTKPRALNYALDFAKGSIIGVLDAEDSPEPDQIHKVARRFHEAPGQVACLQGVLDYYNARTNFLSRAFTLEYASWFRIMLPGLQELGLVVPLGGTTVYFRRSALEGIGGWDAHNVTEDADLGVRLTRKGFRTELFDSVTHEEATCGIWPWIRQRSRWMKGYCMTWAVHMRDPRRLLQDLGTWKFVGFQVLFLGTILHFLTLPVLMTFWAVPLGYGHPVLDFIPSGYWKMLVATFVLTEIVTLAIAAIAAGRAGHRRLWGWIPLLHLYFPLAALAAYVALFDLLRRPFYWAKTEHGISKTSKRRGNSLIRSRRHGVRRRLRPA